MHKRTKSHSGRILTTFGCIAAVAMPATAAPENPYGGGSRIPHEVETIDRGHHQTRVILQEFARCNVKGHPAEVRNYLLEDVGEAQTAKLREKALSFSCLDGAIGPDDLQFRFTGLSLQGALAEQMLKRDGLLSSPLDAATIAPLHHSELTADDLKKLKGTLREEALAQEYVFRFGECVVRADAPDSAALINSEPDSAEEGAAFGKLMPAFRSCVEVNRTLTGDKIEIRGAIGYNYYRLASAPRVPAAAVAAKK